MERVDFQIGQVFERSLKIYFSSFVPIFVLGLVVFAPLVFLNVAFPETMTRGSGSLLDVVLFVLPLILGSLLSAALTSLVLEKLRGRDASIGSCLQKGFQRLPLLLVLNLLMGLIILVGMVLVLIPGLIAVIMLSVAVPVFVAERASIGDSIRRSFRLTKSAFWPVCALFILYFVAMVLVMAPLMLLLGFIGLKSMVALNLGSVLINIFFAGVQAVLAVVVYHELRTKGEGATSDELLEVFS